MAIKIYNTITRRKEFFKSIDEGKINIYVCGPTVYDSCHIGHARSSVIFDVIVKYFRKIGFEVNYVRNFTDIDDKIINRSKKMGMDWYKLSQFYIDSFRKDMKSLNVDTPNVEPRVTDYINEIIDIIKILIKNKSAYLSNGDVYFSVDSFHEYGKLSGRKKKDMIVGSRVKVNSYKNNPLDFTIWKAAKLGEPAWESPWGNGRPGWHIECSAMNNKLLGGKIDMHGGGEDLIFPHHENEIAQSEAAYGSPLANYWIHNGLVNINNNKMSKSLGNWKSVREILKEYHPEAIRLFLLSNHYRKPLNFSENSIASCEKAITKVYRTISRVNNFLGKNKKCLSSGLLWYNFCNAMNDDFNTAKCIGMLFDSVRKINKTMDKINNSTEKYNILELNVVINDVLSIGEILGIFAFSPEEYLNNDNNKVHLNVDLINTLIAKRKKAKENKNWEKADEIRNKLNAMGIQLEDLSNDTIWKKIH